MDDKLMESDTPEDDSHLFKLEPTYKLYNDHAIAVGTFLGGPLVGGYLMAVNFKAWGQQENVRRTWLIAIAAAVVVFTAIYYLPFMAEIPSFIVPLTYTAIMQALYQKYQGKEVKQHLLAGGRLYSTGRGALFGLAGLVLFALTFLLVTWLLEGITLYDFFAG